MQCTRSIRGGANGPRTGFDGRMRRIDPEVTPKQQLALPPLNRQCQYRHYRKPIPPPPCKTLESAHGKSPNRRAYPSLWHASHAIDATVITLHSTAAVAAMLRNLPTPTPPTSRPLAFRRNAIKEAYTWRSCRVLDEGRLEMLWT